MNAGQKCFRARGVMDVRHGVSNRRALLTLTAVSGFIDMLRLQLQKKAKDIYPTILTKKPT